MSIKSLLEDLGYEDVIVFDDYGEETLIGVDSNNRAVYDYEKNGMVVDEELGMHL